MAKFSEKGWSSDTNYNNFTGDALERHMDDLRDNIHCRHDNVSKPRRFHGTAPYIKGFGSVPKPKPVSNECPQDTKDFLAGLIARNSKKSNKRN